MDFRLLFGGLASLGEVCTCKKRTGIYSFVDGDLWQGDDVHWDLQRLGTWSIFSSGCMELH